jgi:hypothetical protein
MQGELQSPGLDDPRNSLRFHLCMLILIAFPSIITFVLSVDNNCGVILVHIIGKFKVCFDIIVSIIGQIQVCFDVIGTGSARGDHMTVQVQ